MAKTLAERRDYARGYNRGRARGGEWAHRLIQLAKAYRDRAAIPADALRECQNCRRWTRGGPSCLWGVCKADFEWGAEPRMWIDTRSGDRERQIITDETFGCVGWFPRQSEGPS